MSRSGFNVLAALLLLWPAGSVARAQEGPPLRTPVVDNPPFDYLDEDGHAGGIVPALMRELGRRIGHPIKFVSSTLRAAQQGLRVERFDVYVMPRTEEWSEDLWFAPTALFNVRYVALASPGSAVKIASLADLAGRRVAVQSHDAGEVLLGRHPEIQRIAVPDYATGMRLVEHGEADFFLGNHDVCLHLINTGRAPFLRAASEVMILAPACFALSRRNPALAEAVSRAAVAMSQDGTIDRLTATWLGGELGALAPPPWVVRHQRIVLLTVGAVLVLLLVFIGSLQALVKKRTQRLAQAEQALRQSEEQYRQIFNTANDAVFLLSLEGNILACSERVVEIYGYAPDDLKGQPFSVLVAGDQQAAWTRNHEQVLAHESHIFEFQHMRNGGEPIHVELSERVIEWKPGRKVIVSCVRNISDRKQAQDALKDSQSRLLRASRMEMAGLMAGQIAHDFNNLLSPMLGLPDLIRDDLPAQSQSRKDLELIHASARRMAEISQQLLTLGRRGSVTQKPLSLNKVVEEAVKGLDLRRREGIEVVQKLDPRLSSVLGGASQLVRAISNLLWNALEAMGDSGVLTIATEQVIHEEAGSTNGRGRTGEFARVSVADTGAGIPETLLDKIFDPFFTTKKSSRQRGSGLGLSVVQAVIQDHQGFVEVHSAISKGSTFALYFPLCGEPLEEDPASATHFRGTERLLIVDDDQLQIDVFSRILAGLGYEVSGATSGEAAVERVRQGTVDLVLLDMVLQSGMDGAETYRRMLEINPRQRAVIISGYAETQRLDEVQRMGAGAVLRKPLSRESLARAVRAELDRILAG